MFGRLGGGFGEAAALKCIDDDFVDITLAADRRRIGKFDCNIPNYLANLPPTVMMTDGRSGLRKCLEGLGASAHGTKILQRDATARDFPQKRIDLRSAHTPDLSVGIQVLE